MSFFFAAPEPTPIPAVRTDETKLALLRGVVEPLLAGAPEGTLPEQVDIFALTVHIRADLPAGLAADDFDGNDVQAIVAEILTP